MHLLAAWVSDFQPVGWGTLAVLGGLTILSVLVDFLASAFGAKKLGASSRAFWGAVKAGAEGMEQFCLARLCRPRATKPTRPPTRVTPDADALWQARRPHN